MSDYSALRQSVERFCEKPDGLFEFISVISCINSLPKGALTGAELSDIEKLLESCPHDHALSIRFKLLEYQID